MTHADLEPWTKEAVQLQLPSGRMRYLVHVTRERCTDCGTGVRTVSVWATRAGHAEAVAWCGHCFNAICEPVDMGDDLRPRHAAVCEAIETGRVSRRWPAVRPALEDLERRGLL